MGCFNMIGSISNMPISYNDDCVAFICIDTKDKSMYAPGQYVPVLMPVFGKYNDYGIIENIVEDANTEFIKRVFEYDVYDIIRAINDHRVGRYNKKSRQIYNDFVDAFSTDDDLDFVIVLEHKAIYDALVKFSYQYIDWIKSYNISKENKLFLENYINELSDSEEDVDYYTSLFYTEAYIENQFRELKCKTDKFITNLDFSFNNGFWYNTYDNKRKTFLKVYQQNPEEIWKEEMKQIYCDACAFYNQLEVMNLFLDISNYGGQELFNAEFAELKRIELDILKEKESRES